MKNNLFILVFCLCGFSLFGQSFDCEEELFPKKDKRTRLFGYANAIGEYRVTPRFLTAKPFVGRNAIVQEGKKFGILNCEGVLVLPTDYDEISSFSNGKGWVKSNGLWGLADSKGRLLIKPIYEDVKEINTFSGTVTWVKKAGLWGLINKENGRFLVNTQYEDVSNISDSAGIARKTGSQDLVYYGDGRVIISEMKKVNRLSQNLFAYQNKEGKYGAFNPLAFIVIRPNWDSIYLNLPHVQVKKDNKFGIKTFKGYDVLDVNFDQISKYVDGFLMTKTANKLAIYSTTGSSSGPASELSHVELGKGGKAIITSNNVTGLWDTKQKKWIIVGAKQKLRFSNSQNWIEVIQQGKCNIFDISKSSYVQTGYDSISVADSDETVRAYKGGKVTFTTFPTFSEGKFYDKALALDLKNYFLSEQNNRFGIVQSTISIVEPTYDLIKSFKGSTEIYFVGSTSGKECLMDISGKVILKPEYSKVIPATKKNTIFQNDGKWGLCSNAGTVILEAKYDSISSPKKDFSLWDFPLVAWKKGKSQLLNEKGNQLTDLEKVEWIYLDEGLWAQKSKEGYKLFNSSGILQGTLVFEKIENFSEGSAPAFLNGKWGFINPFGRLNIQSQFEQLIGFKSGIAYAKQNGKWGVLKKNGAWLVKPIGIDVKIEADGKRRLIMP